MKHILGLITLSIGLASSGVTALHAQETVSLADAEYEAGHYAHALTLFEARAAAGDSAAAERAGQMLYFGSALYGVSVTQDQWRALGYLEKASHAGRPAARQLMQRMLPPAATEEYVPGPAGC